LPCFDWSDRSASQFNSGSCRTSDRKGHRSHRERDVKEQRLHRVESVRIRRDGASSHILHQGLAPSFRVFPLIATRLSPSKYHLSLPQSNRLSALESAIALIPAKRHLARLDLKAQLTEAVASIFSSFEETQSAADAADLARFEAERLQVVEGLERHQKETRQRVEELNGVFGGLGKTMREMREAMREIAERGPAEVEVVTDGLRSGLVDLREAASSSMTSMMAKVESASNQLSEASSKCKLSSYPLLSFQPIKIDWWSNPIHLAVFFPSCIEGYQVAEEAGLNPSGHRLFIRRSLLGSASATRFTPDRHHRDFSASHLFGTFAPISKYSICLPVHPPLSRALHETSTHLSSICVAHLHSKTPLPASSTLTPRSLPPPSTRSLPLPNLSSPPNFSPTFPPARPLANGTGTSPKAGNDPARAPPSSLGISVSRPKVEGRVRRWSAGWKRSSERKGGRRSLVRALRVVARRLGNRRVMGRAFRRSWEEAISSSILRP
jgi:hypothetical protein